MDSCDSPDTASAGLSLDVRVGSRSSMSNSDSPIRVNRACRQHPIPLQQLFEVCSRMAPRSDDRRPPGGQAVSRTLPHYVAIAGIAVIPICE